MSETPPFQNHPDNTLELSVLKTLVFFDQFDFPLLPEEILEHLYQPLQTPHIAAIKGVLSQMAEAGKVELLKGYVFLKGRGVLIEKRKARAFISERLWHRAKFYTQQLQNIPFVRMIAVCNNLAYNNASETSDIDLFIVIQEGRMWLTRFIITLTLQFFGVRRHGKKIAGRFCLSFFVTPKKLNMQEIALKGEDPYLAYWVQTLTPLYGMATYEEFKKVNFDFLKFYGLNFLNKSTKHIHELNKESGLKKVFEFLLKGFIGSGIEYLLKLIYKKRTMNKAAQLDERAKVVVSDDMLKFHNEDRREQYRERMYPSIKS